MLLQVMSMSERKVLIASREQGEPWHDRKVFDFETGAYLGRAVGEPWSDGIEGFITLRQDLEGLEIRPRALCAFVVLDRSHGRQDDA